MTNQEIGNTFNNILEFHYVRLQYLQRRVEVNFGVKIKTVKSTKAMFYYWGYGEAIQCLGMQLWLLSTFQI